MAVTSTQRCEQKTHLRERAIYQDSSNNIIRLLLIRGDYCVYVVSPLGNPTSQACGSVTGLIRRDIFEAGFIFVAECVEDLERGLTQEFRQAGSGYISILLCLIDSLVGWRDELDD